MSDSLNPFFTILARTHTRAILHFCFLILFAVFIFINEFDLLSEVLYREKDKQLHFEGGQLIFTMFYFLFFLLISWFILKHNKYPMTFRLLWVPAIFLLISIFVFSIVIFTAFFKEAIDSTGVGTVDWNDITATLDGAYSPNIKAVLYLLAITPILIPLDMLLQLPKKLTMSTEIEHHEINQYLQQTQSTKQHKNIDTLLIEDDLTCSAVALNFCKKLKFKCAHVDTIQEARSLLKKHHQQLKVIMLDNFVRVESSDDRTTGSEWLEEIERDYPKKDRPFVIALMSGHTDILGEQKKLADIVLKKPWKPSEFLKFLKEKGIV